MLTYDQNYNNPTIDINLPDAVTPQNVDNLTQPIAKSGGSSGFNFNDAISGVLGLLDNGLAVYNHVNDTIGNAAAKSNAENQKVAPTVISAGNPAFVFGLSTNQLLLIAGGLAAILIVPRLLRRA